MDRIQIHSLLCVAFIIHIKTNLKALSIYFITLFTLIIMSTYEMESNNEQNDNITESE
jgi:hypothetical protein